MEVILLSIIRSNTAESKFFVALNGQVERVADIGQFAGDDYTLVTFDFDSLLNYLRLQGLPSPSKLVDIEQLAKQVVGHAANEYDGDAPWNIWQLLQKFYSDSNELTLLQNLYYGFSRFEEVENAEKLFLTLAEHLNSLYKQIINDAEIKDELKRFNGIEKPLNVILAGTTRMGISVDPDKIRAKLVEIDKKLYNVRNQLQTEFGIMAASDYKRIAVALHQEKYHTIAKALYGNDDENYHSLLRLGQENKLVKLLFDEKELSRDKTVLFRIGSLDKDISYPVFEGFGTVTGRILIRHPNWQQLSKVNRDIIIARKGMALVYIDYDQFEAGILADQCGDEVLMEFYTGGDIYNKLSIAAFSTIEMRDLCKKLFFRYSYGMQMERMADFLKEFSPTSDVNELEVKVESFFKQFAKLNEFRTSLNAELLNTGKIGSTFGNFRYKNDELETDETWTVSQRIQGTASLILKLSILEVAKADPEIEFLIPMHDAVLYQVPETKLEEKTQLLIGIFVDSMQRICKKIKGKASPKSFYS